MPTRERMLPVGWYPASAAACKAEIERFIAGTAPLPSGSRDERYARSGRRPRHLCRNQHVHAARGRRGGLAVPGGTDRFLGSDQEPDHRQRGRGCLHRGRDAHPRRHWWRSGTFVECTPYHP